MSGATRSAQNPCAYLRSDFISAQGIGDPIGHQDQNISISIPVSAQAIFYGHGSLFYFQPVSTTEIAVKHIPFGMIRCDRIITIIF